MRFLLAGSAMCGGNREGSGRGEIGWHGWPRRTPAPSPPRLDDSLTPPDNPFLSLACPAPDSPAFASFVLDSSWNPFWVGKERGWRSSGVPCERLAFTSLMISQRGLCAAQCRLPYRTFRSGLVPDHNHTTGRLRLLVCSRENWEIGRIETEMAMGARSRYPRWFAGYLHRSGEA